MDVERPSFFADSTRPGVRATDVPPDRTAGETSPANQPGPAPTNPTSARQSIIVDRPVGDVFALCRDLPRRCRWQRGTLTGELADPDVAGLGARCTETRKGQGGATEQWDLEVVGFERNGLLTIRAECACAQVVERHVFAADPLSAHRTRYTLALEASGARWSAGELQRQIVDHLIHFRDCIESPDLGAQRALVAATRLRRKGD